MIEYTARKLSLKLKSIAPETNENILKFEIARKLNFYSIIIFTVAIGWFGGFLYESFLAMAGCAALRKFTGGRHLPLTACTVFSVLLFTISATLPLNTISMVLLTLLTFFILALYSKRPAHHKIISYALVLTNLFILSPALTIVYIVQAASIIEKRGGADR